MKNKKDFFVISRSCLFWFIMGVFAIPYNLLAATLYITPVRVRHKILSSWGMMFTLLAKYICRANYTIIGKENIVCGPVIIASNHQSTWETMSFTLLFPQHVWILKRELLRVPFFGWAISTLSPIAINRTNGAEAIQQILSQSVQRIKDGFWILIFPEGTRVTPGAVKPFKTGVAKISQALKLPVLPIAHNAGYIMPKQSFLIYPGMTTVVIDKPVYPALDETPEEYTERIEAIIRKNLLPLLKNKTLIFENGKA